MKRVQGRLETLNDRALNRALLARQGLLEPAAGTAVDVVEAIGPLQAQNWSAPRVAIWARTGNAVNMTGDFEAGRLHFGCLLRATLHVVSARQHPDYAAVVQASGAAAWHRTKAAPPQEMEDLRRDLLRFAATPKTAPELTEFIEAWITRHKPPLDPAEIAHQRQYGWRPMLRSPAFVRTPEDGRWNRKAPAAHRAAPVPPERWPDPNEALRNVLGWHLQAFGPASAEDVAQWIGWKTPPIRAALETMTLEHFEDTRGRRLYDVADAPRPDPDVPAPPRLLPWFDNVILAYSPSGRSRILPDAYKDRVYQRANLQWLPAILVDGMVAGTWSPKSGLNAFSALPKPVSVELERLRSECVAVAIV
jgi:hypothetical protein